MTKVIFVSYAQSPAENKGRVAELVASLRASGLTISTDQDVASPQGPPEGWPKWMLDRLDEADWVIVVCNEAYYRRFRGKEEPGRGLGARWEGAIIGQAIYVDGTINRKFIPVLLGNESEEFIPEPLRGATRYRCPSDLPKLISALLGQPAPEQAPAVPPPTIDRPPSKPSPSEPKSPRRSSPQPSAPAGRKRATTWGKIVPYAALSLIAFACGVLVLSLMLWKAETLVRLGLTGRVYYIALLPLGLSVAAFLFGSLRSYAIYTGKLLGGALELGGPIVGFALTVLGGFMLVQDPSTFPLTVFVHGERGTDQIILRKSGKVIIDLGGDRRSEEIGDKGQAFFPAIPATFRGQEVPVSIEAAGYESIKFGLKLRLDGSSLYLPIRAQSGRITGRVQDEDGKPLTGVSINVAGLSTNTGSAGQFEISIPGDRMKAEFLLQAIAAGFAPARTTVVAGGNDVVVILRRQP